MSLWRAVEHLAKLIDGGGLDPQRVADFVDRQELWLALSGLQQMDRGGGQPCLSCELSNTEQRSKSGFLQTRHFVTPHLKRSW